MTVSPCYQGHVLRKNREEKGAGRKQYEISKENLKKESLLVIDASGEKET